MEVVPPHEVDDAVSLRYLHGDDEVVNWVRREEHIDSLLLERRVRYLLISFHDVKLCTGSSPKSS